MDKDFDKPSKKITIGDRIEAAKELVLAKLNELKTINDKLKKDFVPSVVIENLTKIIKDIDVSDLRDNQKRPISELYITTIWKGYFGLTFGGVDSNGNNVGLKQGFDFNLPPDTQFNNPQPWWDVDTVESNFVDSNNNAYPTGYYNTPYGGNVNGINIDFTYLKLK